MSLFLVIPAIDIKDGKCVRLFQGDYGKTTIYSDDPVEVARRWEKEGTRFLHLVDLDGAASGEPKNLATIKAIAEAVSIPVEVGGGVRTLDTIQLLLAAKVTRVILGTVAVEKPELVKEACQQFGEAIVIGVDARDGFVATRGWLEASSISAIELIQRLVDLGAQRYIYTDITRDGTLTEPNFASIEHLLSTSTIPLIASGGVAAVSQLVKLREMGAEGVIVGKALYTGDIDLREALATQTV